MLKGKRRRKNVLGYHLFSTVTDLEYFQPKILSEELAGVPVGMRVIGVSKIDGPTEDSRTLGQVPPERRTTTGSLILTLHLDLRDDKDRGRVSASCLAVSLALQKGQKAKSYLETSRLLKAGETL